MGTPTPQFVRWTDNPLLKAVSSDVVIPATVHSDSLTSNNEPIPAGTDVIINVGMIKDWLMGWAGASIYDQSAITADAAELEIDTSGGTSYIDVTLNVANVALTLAAPELEPGFVKQVTLALAQGTGANLVTWPNNVTWPHGRPPVLSYNAGQVDMVTLLYLGNGVWRGFFVAGGF